MANDDDDDDESSSKKNWIIILIVLLLCCWCIIAIILLCFFLGVFGGGSTKTLTGPDGEPIKDENGKDLQVLVDPNGHVYSALLDKDGKMMTKDGKPLVILMDDDGNELRDADGFPRIGILGDNNEVEKDYDGKPIEVKVDRDKILSDASGNMTRVALGEDRKPAAGQVKDRHGNVVKDKDGKPLVAIYGSDGKPAETILYADGKPVLDKDGKPVKVMRQKDGKVFVAPVTDDKGNTMKDSSGKAVYAAMDPKGNTVSARMSDLTKKGPHLDKDGNHVVVGIGADGLPVVGSVKVDGKDVEVAYGPDGKPVESTVSNKRGTPCTKHSPNCVTYLKKDGSPYNLGEHGELLGEDGNPILGKYGQILDEEGNDKLGANGRMVKPDGTEHSFDDGYPGYSDWPGEMVKDGEILKPKVNHPVSQASAIETCKFEGLTLPISEDEIEDSFEETDDCDSYYSAYGMHPRSLIYCSGDTDGRRDQAFSANGDCASLKENDSCSVIEWGKDKPSTFTDFDCLTKMTFPSCVLEAWRPEDYERLNGEQCKLAMVNVCLVPKVVSSQDDVDAYKETPAPADSALGIYPLDPANYPINFGNLIKDNQPSSAEGQTTCVFRSLTYYSWFIVIADTLEEIKSLPDPDPIYDPEYKCYMYKKSGSNLKLVLGPCNDRPEFPVERTKTCFLCVKPKTQ